MLLVLLLLPLWTLAYDFYGDISLPGDWTDRTLLTLQRATFAPSTDLIYFYRLNITAYNPPTQVQYVHDELVGFNRTSFSFAAANVFPVPTLPLAESLFSAYYSCGKYIIHYYLTVNHAGTGGAAIDVFDVAANAWHSPTHITPDYNHSFFPQISIIGQNMFVTHFLSPNDDVVERFSGQSGLWSQSQLPVATAASSFLAIWPAQEAQLHWFYHDYNKAQLSFLFVNGSSVLASFNGSSGTVSSLQLPSTFENTIEDYHVCVNHLVIMTAAAKNRVEAYNVGSGTFLPAKMFAAAHQLMFRSPHGSIYVDSVDTLHVTKLEVFSDITGQWTSVTLSEMLLVPSSGAVCQWSRTGRFLACYHSSGSRNVFFIDLAASPVLEHVYDTSVRCSAEGLDTHDYHNQVPMQWTGNDLLLPCPLASSGTTLPVIEARSNGTVHLVDFLVPYIGEVYSTYCHAPNGLACFGRFNAYADDEFYDPEWHDIVAGHILLLGASTNATGGYQLYPGDKQTGALVLAMPAAPPYDQVRIIYESFSPPTSQFYIDTMEHRDERYVAIRYCEGFPTPSANGTAAMLRSDLNWSVEWVDDSVGCDYKIIAAADTLIMLDHRLNELLVQMNNGSFFRQPLSPSTTLSEPNFIEISHATGRHTDLLLVNAYYEPSQSIDVLDFDDVVDYDPSATTTTTTTTAAASNSTTTTATTTTTAGDGVDPTNPSTFADDSSDVLFANTNMMLIMIASAIAGAMLLVMLVAVVVCVLKRKHKSGGQKRSRLHSRGASKSHSRRSSGLMNSRRASSSNYLNFSSPAAPMTTYDNMSPPANTVYATTSSMASSKAESTYQAMQMKPNFASSSDSIYTAPPPKPSKSPSSASNLYVQAPPINVNNYGQGTFNDDVSSEYINVK